MTAQLFDFRAFESVRSEASGMGDSVYRDAIRKVIREQQQGRSGKNVAWELNMVRRLCYGGKPVNPSGGSAA